MSTIEITATTKLSKTLLTRRISELMNEKGGAYSIRSFAERIGVSRELLRLCLVGERPITPSTLEKIAQGLGVTVERLRQMDTFKQEQELETLLTGEKRTKVMLLRANSIATELVEVAKGITERGFALHNLGRVQYLEKNYDEAHKTWLRTLDYAKKLQDHYDEKHLLLLVTVNLMVTYSIRKEYSNIEEFLRVVEEAFADDPLKMGMAEYTSMIVQEEKGHLELAKKHAYRSFKYLKQTESNEQIGHGLINIAHCEYRLGNYEYSAKSLSEAISILKPFENILIIAVKEYAKSLMQLRDFSAVIQLVEEYSSLAKKYPDYRGKLQMMYARATDNPSYAEAVTNDSNVSMNVRYYACKSLMEYYTLKRDFESMVRYYEKSRIFSNTKSEYLNEGGF